MAFAVNQVVKCDAAWDQFFPIFIYETARNWVPDAINYTHVMPPLNLFGAGAETAEASPPGGAAAWVA